MTLRAQGLPAVYALPAVGNFLDSWQHLKVVDGTTARAVLQLVQIHSDTYQNLATKEARAILSSALKSGEELKGEKIMREPGGGEAELMEQYRATLLDFLRRKMTAEHFSSLEPSTSSVVRL